MESLGIVLAFNKILLFTNFVSALITPESVKKQLYPLPSDFHENRYIRVEIFFFLDSFVLHIFRQDVN